MERRRCGNSGLKLSVLGLGCWALGGGDYWGAQRPENTRRVVRQAIDLGINFFDTAEVYNEGRSEEALGRALQGVPRDSVVIGSKVAPSHAGPDALEKHCDASLRRLDTDYVDLYMVHWPLNARAVSFFTDDPDIVEHPPRPEEVFRGLERLKKKGKVRHVGVSNFGVRQLSEALDLGTDVAANQLHYNLLSRAIEAEVLPLCRRRGVGVIAYMALLQGVLTEAFDSIDDLPEKRTRTRHFHRARSSESRHGEEGAEEEITTARRTLRRIADEAGRPLAELALAWVLARDGITCSLVGTTDPEHLRANAQAVEQPLSPSVVEKLDEATRPVWDKLGDNIDYWEGTANSRSY